MDWRGLKVKWKPVVSLTLKSLKSSHINYPVLCPRVESASGEWRAESGE